MSATGIRAGVVLTCLASAFGPEARAEDAARAIVFPLKRGGAVTEDQYKTAVEGYQAACASSLSARRLSVGAASGACQSAADGCGEEDLRCWHARCGADATVTVVQAELTRLGESFTVTVTARRLTERETAQSAQVRVTAWENVRKAIEEAVRKVVMEDVATPASPGTTGRMAAAPATASKPKAVGGARVLGYVAAGLAVAAAAGGGYFAYDASATRFELDRMASGGAYSAADRSRVGELVGQCQRSSDIAAGLFGAAGAAAVVAVVSWITSLPTKPTASPGPGGATMTISF